MSAALKIPLPTQRVQLSLVKTHVWPSHIEKQKTRKPSLRLVPEMIQEPSDISSEQASDVLFKYKDSSGKDAVLPWEWVAPALPDVIGGIGTAVGTAAGVVVGVCTMSTNTQSPADDNPNDCAQQWDRAYELCGELFGTPGSRGITGNDYNKCVYGLVTEACGGNAVQHD